MGHILITFCMRRIVVMSRDSKDVWKWMAMNDAAPDREQPKPGETWQPESNSVLQSLDVLCPRGFMDGA